MQPNYSQNGHGGIMGLAMRLADMCPDAEAVEVRSAHTGEMSIVDVKLHHLHMKETGQRLEAAIAEINASINDAVHLTEALELLGDDSQ